MEKTHYEIRCPGKSPLAEYATLAAAEKACLDAGPGARVYEIRDHEELVTSSDGWSSDENWDRR